MHVADMTASWVEDSLDYPRSNVAAARTGVADCISCNMLEVLHVLLVSYIYICLTDCIVQGLLGSRNPTMRSDLLAGQSCRVFLSLSKHLAWSPQCD